MPKTIFAIGERFGRLTILKELPQDKYGHRRYLAECDCGSIKKVWGTNLRPGNTTGCGSHRSLKHAADALNAGGYFGSTKPE